MCSESSWFWVPLYFQRNKHAGRKTPLCCGLSHEQQLREAKKKKQSSVVLAFRHQGTDLNNSDSALDCRVTSLIRKRKAQKRQNKHWVLAAVEAGYTVDVQRINANCPEGDIAELFRCVCVCVCVCVLAPGIQSISGLNHFVLYSSSIVLYFFLPLCCYKLLNSDVWVFLNFLN